MRRSRAFTLVELLVVIGIIALLMSILLPSLNKARQQAYRIKCMNQMRQMMFAEKIYESEWKGWVMWANWGGFRDQTGNFRYGVPGWLYADVSSGNNGLPPEPINPEFASTGLVYQYLNKNLSVFHCPLDEPPYIFGGTSALTSFLMNGAMLDYGNTSANPSRFTLNAGKFKPWAVIWFEALENKSSTGSVWNDGSSYPDEELLSPRHQKGGQVVCMDGHVEWWSPDEYNNYAYNRTGNHFSPNPLWCAPDLPYGGDRSPNPSNPSPMN